jgi:hypothetical protein
MRAGLLNPRRADAQKPQGSGKAAANAGFKHPTIFNLTFFLLAARRLPRNTSANKRGAWRAFTSMPHIRSAFEAPETVAEAPLPSSSEGAPLVALVAGRLS